MVSIARITRMMVWIGGLSLAASLPVAAQRPGSGPARQPATGSDGEQLELRFYDVSFLRDRSSGLISSWLGQNPDERGVEIFGGVGQGGAGMPAAGGSMGGMGGGGMSGGGMFHVPDQIQPQFGDGMGGMGGGMGGTSSLPASATQPGGARVGQLIQLIVGGVEPDSWDSVGGLATIHRVGHLLGIYQTPAAHAKIEAVFEELRRRIASQRSVEVQLRLVTVEPQQANGLSQAGEEAWNELAAREQAIHLSVRCLDGQRASIAAGVRRSYVVKIVPVVGAAVEQATQSDSSIGYSPIVITPLVGVYGQILPQVMQRAESDLSKHRAEIDLGIVLASAPSEVTSAAFGTGQTIDRLELQTAELETSIVATENQWTLAGVAVVTDGTSNITAGDVLPHLAVLAKWTQAEE